MNVAIVLSGGTGSRLGEDIPKQYIEVASKPIIIYPLEVMDKSSYIDAIQIVAASEWVSKITDWAREHGVAGKIKGYSAPGENRQLSIYNGLKDVLEYADESDYVFIHDAARPNLSQQMIADSIEGMAGNKGVLPVLPMKDTVYKSYGGGSIDELLDRDTIFAGQAPETFVLGAYYRANQDLVDSNEIYRICGSTEVAIMAGMNVHMIPGDEENYKITTKKDLDRFLEDKTRNSR
mgnify:FL=1